MTWNSLLLSKGSIFTRTHFNGTKVTAASSNNTTPPRNIQRRRASRISGFIIRRYKRVVQPSVSCPEWSPLPAYFLSSLNAAHGETTKATISENSIAAEAPTGIGRMYGPIRPRTKAMGRIAPITANVARMVGLPTSSTASTATSDKDRPRLSGNRKWRTMFSTTTMASSTRMPMEKISANNVTRFRV